jgi:transcriptional regulator with XRE-family HTH domain
VPLTDSISYRSQILNPEQYLLAKEEVLDICREIKEKLLVKLPFRQSRDQGIFRMRYGLDGSMRIHTLEEVGTFYGVTRERVRQIEFKGWRKLMKRAAEVSENWLFVRLKTINRLEDLLGEDLAEEIFRSDHPSELKKIRFTGQKISQRKEVKMNLGQKNDLAVFLRERRAHLGKSQKQIALALGMPPNQYSQYESRGFLPRDPERLQKLANALEVSVEKVLMKKGHQKPAADSDILPLIKAIAESGCQKFFLDDLHFLLQTQQGLRTPMTAEIVAALLRHRS